MGGYHHASGLFVRASAGIGPGDVYDAFALSLLVGRPLPAEDRRLADFEAGWLRNHFVVVFLPMLRQQVEKYLGRPDRHDPDRRDWLATAPDADADELARMFGTATFRSERHRGEHPDDVHNDRWAEIAAAVGGLSRASGLGDVALALAGQGGLLNLVHNTGTNVLDKLPGWRGLWEALEACAGGAPAQVYAGARPDMRRLLRRALPRIELLGATASSSSEPKVAGFDPFRNLRGDLWDALAAACEMESRDPSEEELEEFSVERRSDVPVEELLRWMDYSSWGEWTDGELAEILRDGGEEALREELSGFRGPGWSGRAMGWLRDGVPAVVLMEMPDLLGGASGYPDLCDGRGRVSFMVGMGIKRAAVAVATRTRSAPPEDDPPPVTAAASVALKVLPNGKGQPADRVFDCVKCGACCACGWCVDLTGGETKRFLADPELRGMVRLNQGIGRWESGEDDEPGFVKEINAKGFGSQCAALRGKVGRHAPCSIYEKRPKVCRDFKLGSNRCLEARAIHGIDRRKGNATSGCRFVASELPGETRLSLECRCADDFGAGYKDESARTGEDRGHIENYEETREAQLAMAEEAASLGLDTSVSDSDDKVSRHSDAYVYFPASRMGEVAAMLAAVGLDGDILDVPADFPEAEAERVKREHGWSVERAYSPPGGGA
jgi:Fe-S-cluster containining protein